MVQPVFKDVAEKEVQVDLGVMEEAETEKINIFIISNSRMVPERKRDKLIDLIMEVSSEHNDLILVTAIDDESVSLAPADPKIGPAVFKIYFQAKKTVEATASKSPEVDLFLKDLFIKIQELTNDLYSIFSYHDHAAYEKKGVFPLNSDNNEPEDSDKEFLTIEEYQEKKKTFHKLVERMDKKGE